ncbi:hypothetical protein [Streptacidiphilus sp. PAMC 29251]
MPDGPTADLSKERLEPRIVGLGSLAPDGVQAVRSFPYFSNPEIEEHKGRSLNLGYQPTPAHVLVKGALRLGSVYGGDAAKIAWARRQLPKYLEEVTAFCLGPQGGGVAALESQSPGWTAVFEKVHQVLEPRPAAGFVDSGAYDYAREIAAASAGVQDFLLANYRAYPQTPAVRTVTGMFRWTVRISDEVNSKAYTAYLTGVAASRNPASRSSTPGATTTPSMPRSRPGFPPLPTHWTRLARNRVGQRRSARVRI